MDPLKIFHIFLLHFPQAQHNGTRDNPKRGIIPVEILPLDAINGVMFTLPIGC